MWWWLLGWCVLLVLAAAFLALVVWGLVKRFMELGRALGSSAERLSPAMEQIAQSYEPARSVLSDPTGVPVRRRRAGHRRRWGVG
jgi:Sec-independent protein translocase protein TatA